MYQHRSPAIHVNGWGAVFQRLCNEKTANATLVFSHPEVEHGITNEGIPQVNLDQLNPRQMMDPTYVPTPLPSHSGQIGTVRSGHVLNYVSFGMKLTRGKLLKGSDWDEWQQSE